MNYSGKKVLITGASAGIGAEFAKQFSQAGAYCILVARREEKLKEVASTLKGEVELLPADLSDSSDLEKVVEYIKNNQIDVLINNAGRGSFGPFEEIDKETELELVSLNITATLHLAHAVIPQMKERRGGAIISVSSIVAFQPLAYMATYAGTKAFNYIHSLSLREELKPYGVKVVTLCPGPTATEFGGVARVPGGLTGISRDSVSQVVKETIETLDRNGAVVIPTLRAKMISLPSRILPKVISSWIAAKVMRRTWKDAQAGRTT